MRSLRIVACACAYAYLLWRRPLVQLLVECQTLTLQFGQIEPFFCSFALYDLGKRTKISENFYFDRNDDDVSSSYSSLPR